MSEQAKINILLIIVIICILIASGSMIYEVNFKQKDVITSELKDITNYSSVKGMIRSSFKNEME